MGVLAPPTGKIGGGAASAARWRNARLSAAAGERGIVLYRQ